MDIEFASRKVRMGREYYVEARTADGQRHRIGSFKFRVRANDWIAQNAANWTPDVAQLEPANWVGGPNLSSS